MDYSKKQFKKVINSKVMMGVIILTVVFSLRMLSPVGTWPVLICLRFRNIDPKDPCYIPPKQPKDIEQNFGPGYSDPRRVQIEFRNIKPGRAIIKNEEKPKDCDFKPEFKDDVSKNEVEFMPEGDLYFEPVNDIEMENISQSEADVATHFESQNETVKPKNTTLFNKLLQDLFNGKGNVTF